MKYLKDIKEVIKVPIEVGDVVLGGRFKNKKTVVKKIGKNKKGDITINDKPLLKYRIVKESLSNFRDDVNTYLAHIIDDGFIILVDSRRSTHRLPHTFEYSIRITKSENYLKPFYWSEISEDVQRLLRIILSEKSKWTVSTVYTISDLDKDTYKRNVYKIDDILGDKDLGLIDNFYIQFRLNGEEY